MYLAIDMTSIFAVLFLVLLEGLLSMDNALALAVAVRHLPPQQQKKALTFGICRALAFRFLSLFLIKVLMGAPIVKLIGASYLLFLCLWHFLGDEGDDKPIAVGAAKFWTTVAMVEFLDISFSLDSILAAGSLGAGLIVTFIGGCLGIIMMRFASVGFIRLLKIFPKLETTAYLLIGVLAVKLFCEGFDSRIDFYSSQSPFTWLFWSAVFFSVASGLRGNHANVSTDSSTDHQNIS